MPNDAVVDNPSVADALARAAELGSDAEAVRRHLGGMPARYAEAVAPRAIVRHTIMAHDPLGPNEVRTRVTRNADTSEVGDDVDELDVVARDLTGWFAKVAGVISLHDGEIVLAEAFSRADGLAVDTFKVRPSPGAGGSWWARVEGDLVDAAAGRLAVRARVARVVRDDAGRASRQPETATRVRCDADELGTRVEVRTLDRKGVLYAIASAFTELDVDIVLARVGTTGHEAIDVFVCRDVDGRPLGADHLAELQLAIVSSLEWLSRA